MGFFTAAPRCGRRPRNREPLPKRIVLASVRGAACLDGIETTLQESELMPRLAELAPQAVGFGPMALIALLRST